jgi:hypothetical protein
MEILQVDAVHPGIKNKFFAQPGTQSNVESETEALALYDGQQK